MIHRSIRIEFATVVGLERRRRGREILVEHAPGANTHAPSALRNIPRNRVLLDALNRHRAEHPVEDVRSLAAESDLRMQLDVIHANEFDS